MKQFIEYWDDFHKEWYNDIIKNGKPTKTNYKGWTILTGYGENKHKIWRYFPEPYWGDPTKQLDGIFLNINPGGGEDDFQDIFNQKKSVLYKEYINNLYYGKTMSAMQQSKYNNYITNEKFFINKRRNWLAPIIGKQSEKTNVLMTELVPWHTKKASGLGNFINNNLTKILNDVIVPLDRIAQNIEGAMKGKIIVRGQDLVKIINTDIKNNNILKAKQIDQFIIYNSETKKLNLNYLLTVFNIVNTKFMIFTGGGGMALPKNTHLICNNTKSGIANIKNSPTVKDFVLSY